MIPRIPFEEAINEPLLFKKQFSRLTPGIKAILKFTYGLPPTADDLAYWHAYHGAGKFDDLGYLLEAWDSGVIYRPGQEMSDITLIVGRRSTKTSGVSSFIVAYEALCGGHQEYVGFENQNVVFLQVAQDLQTAKSNLRQFILDLLESSPIGKNEMKKSKVVEEGGSKKRPITAVSIVLNNRSLITVGPPTIKLRSQAVAVCAADEMAFWAKDKDSANPDSEVIRAVTPAMASFPYRKLVKTSTPMTEEGVLWESHNIGTYGHKLLDKEKQQGHKRTLVLKGPSAPLAPAKVLPRVDLQVEKLKDPSAFRREFLAEFSKSVSGFLSKELLQLAVEDGVRIRDPKPGILYIATLDPAFRKDAFAFSIGHMEEGVYVLDVCQGWRGTHEKPISPTTCASAIASFCRAYGIRIVTSDQYHNESLSDILQDLGLVLEPCYLSQKIKLQMWGEVQGLLNQGKLRLLDHPGLIEEMAKMEKTLTPTGGVKIEGTHDDLATAVALNVLRCLQYGEKAKPVAQAPRPTLAQQMDARFAVKKAPQAWWQY